MIQIECQFEFEPKDLIEQTFYNDYDIILFSGNVVKIPSIRSDRIKFLIDEKNYYSIIENLEITGLDLGDYKDKIHPELIVDMIDKYKILVSNLDKFDLANMFSLTLRNLMRFTYVGLFYLLTSEEQDLNIDDVAIIESSAELFIEAQDKLLNNINNKGETNA